MTIELSYDDLVAIRRAVGIIKQGNMRRFKCQSAVEVLQRILDQSRGGNQMLVASKKSCANYLFKALMRSLKSFLNLILFRPLKYLITTICIVLIGVGIVGMCFFGGIATMEDMYYG